MSKATFTLAYDGPALSDGTMDVRDLAPALLAVGQLFDAANSVLNDDATTVTIQVKATGRGSFEVYFQIAQSLHEQLVHLLNSEEVIAAINLKELILGGAFGLIWLIRRLKGRNLPKVEKLSESHVRITVEGESFDVPLQLLRLYQDIAVRDAAEKLISQPLQKEGIDTFEVRENNKPVVTVKKDEAKYFKSPELLDEVLIEETRRTAYSILSLAFKEDNKWRLYDGVSSIPALIEDHDFLKRVDANQIAFAKGDILICDVLIVQKRTKEGLKAEYFIKKVIEHKTAMRQIPFEYGEPEE